MISASRTFRTVAAFSMTVAIALTLAACGSSSSETQATPTSTGDAVQTVGHPNVWVLGTLPRSTDYLREVACATETQCVAVGISGDYRAGVIVYSTDGGRHWASATVPTAVADVQDVSCGDQVTCVATGSTAAAESLFLTTRDGGAHWVAAPAPPHTVPMILSCTGTSCLAFAATPEGDGLLSSMDGGDSWTPLPVPAAGDGGWGVACFPFGQCWFSTSKADRASLFVTDDFGKTWTNRTPSESSAVLTHVFCYDEARCWAASEGVFATSDGGEHWTRPKPPPGGLYVPSISCATASECWLLNDNPVSRRREVLSTSDAGLVWTEDILPPLPGEPTALVCPGASRCVAVGQGMAMLMAP